MCGDLLWGRGGSPESPVQSQLRGVDAHLGCVAIYLGDVEAHLRVVEAQLGGVEDHPVCVEICLGGVGAHLGEWKLTLETLRLTLESWNLA
jgi:hypothetical protein